MSNLRQSYRQEPKIMPEVVVGVVGVIDARDEEEQHIYLFEKT